MMYTLLFEYLSNNAEKKFTENSPSLQQWCRSQIFDVLHNTKSEKDTTSNFFQITIILYSISSHFPTLVTATHLNHVLHMQYRSIRLGATVSSLKTSKTMYLVYFKL